MAARDLANLDTWDNRSGKLNVIIETSKGSRNKLKYDSERDVFELSKVLPCGLIFPFDFGFIPSTVGDDGDPLDVLVLMEEPVPAGCKIPARVIGVIEANQTEDGKTERNDRLIAVADHSEDHKQTRSLKDLSDNLVCEIEHFFVSYNEMAGKRFKVIARHGPGHGEKLIEKGAKRFRKSATTDRARNGKPKVEKR